MISSIEKVGKSFSRERRRLQTCLAVLRFLITCRKHNVIPKFIHVRCNQKTRRCQRIIHYAKIKILRSTIASLRRKIAATERKVYSLHLQLTKSLHPLQWRELDVTSFHQAQDAMLKKECCLRRKLPELLERDTTSEFQRKEATKDDLTSSQTKLDDDKSCGTPVDGKTVAQDESDAKSNVFLNPCANNISVTPEDKAAVSLRQTDLPPIRELFQETLLAAESNHRTTTPMQLDYNLNSVIKDNVSKYSTIAPKPSFPDKPTPSSTGILRLASRPRNPSIVNLSKITIPPPQLKLLEKGLGFSPSPHRYPLENIICATENAITRKPFAVQNTIRNAISSICKTEKSPTQNLTREERSHLNEIKNNREIIITKADKGGATVIMSFDDYHSKVKQLLSGPEYTPIQSDPTEKVLQNLKDMLKPITIFEDKEKRKIIPSNPSPPRFYAVPKIHKPNNPLRPIVSYCGSPTYFLAKYLNSLISPIVGGTPHSLKNRLDLLDSLPTTSDDDILVSFDVQNLFTSTPVDEALACLKKRLEKSDMFSKIHIDEILTMTKFCVNSTYFNSSEGFFRQTEGLPMGSPLSPPLCNLFMENFENSALSQTKLIPKLWKRYMDDVFSIWQHGINEIQNFLAFLNNLNPAINFTVEIEDNAQLPFMDILLSRNSDGSLSTDVYRKPCFTNSYFDFNSCHHPSQTVSPIKSLVDRALQVCSTTEALDTELAFIRELFKIKNYPVKVINSTISKCISRYQSTKEIQNTTTLEPIREPQNKSIALIPFHPNLSFKIANIFQRNDIRTIHIPPNKFGNILSSSKPNIPLLSKQGIYSIPCECGQIYIGQTRRKLAKRISEHKTQVKFLRADTSALANHVFQFDHKIQWEKTNILASPKTNVGRNIRESLEIFKNKNSVLNNDEGPARIDAWLGLVKPLRLKTPQPTPVASAGDISPEPPCKLQKLDNQPTPTNIPNKPRRSQRLKERRT